MFKIQRNTLPINGIIDFCYHDDYLKTSPISLPSNHYLFTVKDPLAKLYILDCVYRNVPEIEGQIRWWYTTPISNNTINFQTLNVLIDGEFKSFSTSGKENLTEFREELLKKKGYIKGIVPFLIEIEKIKSL